MIQASTESLASRLRHETRALHVAAERSGVMRAVLRSTVDRATYLRMLRSLGLIYRRLESELAATHSPVASAFHRPELARSAAIARDEAIVAGQDAAMQHIAPASMAATYDARLREIASRAPHRLVAHAYVRYFGDLSGGQLLEPLIRKAIDLPPAAGTDFYRFTGIDDLEACKQDLRALLDAIPSRSPEADDIVDEAQWSFRAHAELFEELAPAPTA